MANEFASDSDGEDEDLETSRHVFSLMPQRNQHHPKGIDSTSLYSNGQPLQSTISLTRQLSSGRFHRIPPRHSNKSNSNVFSKPKSKGLSKAPSAASIPISKLPLSQLNHSLSLSSFPSRSDTLRTNRSARVDQLVAGIMIVIIFSMII